MTKLLTTKHIIFTGLQEMQIREYILQKAEMTTSIVFINNAILKDKIVFFFRCFSNNIY